MRRRKVRKVTKLRRRVSKRYTDPEKFYMYRKICGITKQECADFLNVSLRTIQAWESSHTRIPYPAFKLMRIHANGGLLAKQWKGWTVRDDYICSPDGRTWQQCELYYIANYISMARYWLADQKRKTEGRKAALKRRLNHKFKVVDGGKKW